MNKTNNDKDYTIDGRVHYYKETTAAAASSMDKSWHSRFSKIFYRLYIIMILAIAIIIGKKSETIVLRKPRKWHAEDLTEKKWLAALISAYNCTTTAKCEYISRSDPNQLKLNNNNLGQAVGSECSNEEIYLFLIQKSKIEREKIKVSNCVVFNLHNMIYVFHWCHKRSAMIFMIYNIFCPNQ